MTIRTYVINTPEQMLEIMAMHKKGDEAPQMMNALRTWRANVRRAEQGKAAPVAADAMGVRLVIKQVDGRSGEAWLIRVNKSGVRLAGCKCRINLRGACKYVREHGMSAQEVDMRPQICAERGGNII